MAHNNFIVSLEMKFVSHIDSMDFYNRVQSATRGLGLAIPARADVEQLYPTTALIRKMSCTPAIYQRLIKLLKDPAERTAFFQYNVDRLCLLATEAPKLQFQKTLPQHSVPPPYSTPPQNSPISPPSMSGNGPPSRGPFLIPIPTNAPLTNPKPASFTGTSTLSPTPSVKQTSTASNAKLAQPIVASVLNPLRHTKSLTSRVTAKMPTPSGLPNGSKQLPVSSSNKRPISDVDQKTTDLPLKRLKVEETRKVIESPPSGSPAKASAVPNQMQKEKLQIYVKQKQQPLFDKISELEGTLKTVEQALDQTTKALEAEKKQRFTLKAREQELDRTTKALEAEKKQSETLLRERNQKSLMLQSLKDILWNKRKETEGLRQELASEQKLRLEAEKIVEGVRREMAHPFIVPALIDAFKLLHSKDAGTIPDSSVPPTGLE